MSIIIKNLKMPANCLECPLSIDGECRARTKAHKQKEPIVWNIRPDWCPLRECKNRKRRNATNEIQRVSEEVSGVKNGVALDTQCVHSEFLENDMIQHLLPCRILTRQENGAVSITYCIDGQTQMISVRINELLALLGEAKAAYGNEK